MNDSKQTAKVSTWDQIDKKIFIPGSIVLLSIVACGAFFPNQSEVFLNGALAWIMDNLKFVYILCIIGVASLCLFLLFSKYGNIRFGGKNAKPSIKTSTWITLSLTGSIAIGICFFGVSGPVNNFMNPPEFLGVEGGSLEAIVHAIKFCFLHYGLPPYFIMVTLGMAIGLAYYNSRRSLRGSSALYPLLGEKTNGWIGNVVNVLMVTSLICAGSNMGLAVIQLNAGIGTVAGLAQTPSFETAIIIFYTVATAIFATSGVHKLMGKLSNVNAALYVFILLFILIVGPTNRIIGLLFTTLGEYIADFIPMITFADPASNGDWQSNNTMYFYAWNVFPALMHALFYVSISYGRSLRQYLVVNCLIPCGMVFIWYATFGGTAIFGILEGSGLYELMQEFGQGIATFAFLDTLPLGSILKWVFIFLAMMTFVTFSDSIAFSFPMMFMKETAIDASETKTPRSLTLLVSLFMGAVTWVLLFIGGYDAITTAITVLALPAFVFTIFVVVAIFKFVLQREKYDLIYQEELEKEKNDSLNAVTQTTTVRPEEKKSGAPVTAGVTVTMETPPPKL